MQVHYFHSVLFHEWLCEKKVPIVLVLTSLETEQDMEDVWIRLKSTFDKHGIVVDGCACITAANGQPGGTRSRMMNWCVKLLERILMMTWSGEEVAYTRATDGSGGLYSS